MKPKTNKLFREGWKQITVCACPGTHRDKILWPDPDPEWVCGVHDCTERGWWSCSYESAMAILCHKHFAEKLAEALRDGGAWDFEYRGPMSK